MEEAKIATSLEEFNPGQILSQSQKEGVQGSHSCEQTFDEKELQKLPFLKTNEILKEAEPEPSGSQGNSKFTTFADEFDIDDVKVFNPKMTSQGHMSYTFNGFDKSGGFRNVDKRYSELLDFYQWVKERYQGLLIPMFPPKKMFGNKDSRFVEERRH